MEEKIMEQVEKILKDHNRPTMLPKPMPCYEHDFSMHPEHIRVSFSDGTTAVYDIRVDQPAPQFIDSIRIIRKMKQGYVFQTPRRRRKRA